MTTSATAADSIMPSADRPILNESDVPNRSAATNAPTEPRVIASQCMLPPPPRVVADGGVGLSKLKLGVASFAKVIHPKDDLFVLDMSCALMGHMKAVKVNPKIFRKRLDLCRHSVIGCVIQAKGMIMEFGEAFGTIDIDMVPCVGKKTG